MLAITIKKPTTVINTIIKFGFIIAGSLLFNVLFWKEKMAVNCILFFAFICIGIKQFNPKAYISGKVKWLFLTTLFSLVMVVLHNTLLSKITFFISLFLMAGYCQYINNSLLYAGGSIFQSVLYFLPVFCNSIKQLFLLKNRKFRIWKKLRLFILPIIIVTIFFFVYLNANKVFASITERFVDDIDIVLSHLFSWVEPQRLLFLILGLIITGGLLVRYIKAPLEIAESYKKDRLERTRKNKADKGFATELVLIFTAKNSTGTLALKYEYKSGILCLILLNGLLLLVNITDVVYVWFGFKYSHNLNLTKFVHEGAELLVVSILLAMLVVLFFFRGNLNFLAKNKYLKLLAYAWIAQNTVLAFSVCVRNVYYIHYVGLAYKRIALFFYILLVFIGLVSIMIKISKRKSSYYLWRINAMATFIVLVLSNCVDWDLTIANYNINSFNTTNKNKIDIGFLLQMNDHVLPLLEKNKSWICNSSVIDTAIKTYFVDSAANEENDGLIQRQQVNNCAFLQYRMTYFLESNKNYSWLSWNWADENTRQELVKLNAHP